MKMCLRKDGFYSKDISIPYKRLGSEYGGWCIYPDPINEQSIVYSFGIGEDFTFDMELIAFSNATVHGFDFTPRSIEYVRSNNRSLKFIFHPYGLSNEDGVLEVFPPWNLNFVSLARAPQAKTSRKSIEVPVKTITTIIRELNHCEIDILKMDIEGCEFDVLDDILNLEKKPGQLLIELHHFMKGFSIVDTKKAVKKIRDAGYLMFAISPQGKEFSFIHKDLLETRN